MKPDIVVATVTPLAGRKSYGDLERENVRLREKLALIRECIDQRRYGDARKLTTPEKSTAPIAATGDLA